MMFSPRTCPSPSSILCGALLTACLGFYLAPDAAGQYMAITTDNPADSTLLNPSGVTVLTLTLDTNHDRDGTLQVCNSHSNRGGCGAVLTGQPLDVFSYTVTLSASGGTVQWGTFTAADPNYAPLGPDLADDRQTEFTRSLPPGSVTPPGLVVLGSIPVTVLSGSPRIEIASGTQPLNPFGFGTGFGTSCDAYNFANTYMLGDRQHLCATGDWVDTDGVPRAPPNRAPELSPIPDVTVTEGLTADQVISALDPDGDPLTFSKVTGPAYMSVSTLSPATGNIHLMTQFLDAGSFASVRASDGLLTADGSFAIHVTQGGTHAPVIDPIQDIIMEVGQSGLTQGISASNPDARAVTFQKVSGPAFLTVATNSSGSPALGTLTLRPGPSNVGVYQAVVAVQFADFRSSWAFTITVRFIDHEPMTASTGSTTVREGQTSLLTFAAVDQDGDAICLRPIGLPSFASSPSFACGNGSTSLEILFAPGYSDAGLYPFSVSMSSTRFLASLVGSIQVINVDRGPTLDPIADMNVRAGETADQPISASDPDSDPLTFAKDSGPAFLSVSNLSPSTGNVHLAPSLNDPGVYPSAVLASDDGLLSDGQAFTITVTPRPNRCPTAAPGGPYSGIQGVPVALDGSASSDPDGEPLAYHWDFDAADGIGVDATGAQIEHIFTTAGSRTVTLTVTDTAPVPCSNAAATTADIFLSCAATVWNSSDKIRLGPGRPTWSVLVQPEDGCYTNADVRLDTFVLQYGDKQIAADPAKTSVSEDKNHDGVNEVLATFSKQSLRTLFQDAGLSGGHSLVTLTIEAELTSGGRLRGTTQVDVQNNVPSASDAVVSPNPLNPQATLTFTVAQPGALRIQLYDIHGRLARTLVDEGHRDAGTFDIAIDGLDARGQRLPSGVYFIRGVASGHEFKRAITILK